MNIILITLLLIIYGIISYKKPEWGLYLIAFLLPSYLIRFKIGSIPFTFLESMILILFLIWVIKELKDKNLLNIIKKLPSCKFFIPGILLFLAITISIFTSPNFNSALGIWKAYFIEPFLLFIIFVNTIKTKEKINKLIWSLGLSAAIVSTIAIIQYLSGIGIPESYNLPNIKRATSIYDYPSAVGLFLAPILTLFIGLIVEKFRMHNNKDSKSNEFNLFENNKKITLGLMIIISLIFTTVLAKTEGAIIAVLVATFFIFMFIKWRKWIMLGTIILSILVLLIPQSRNYIVPLLTFQDVSGDVRVALWQGTLRLIENHPIFGAGLAGFPELYKKYKEAKHVEIPLYAHNIFFDFWIQTGILGLISFIWIIINYFKLGFRNLKNHSSYVFPLITVMICILIYGLVDVPYFKNDLSCLFWIFMGMITVINKYKFLNN